uniref:Nuclear export mediator factor NEMF homolog n=2 Tax=Cacopsylla melanoneura TaxID=428564 RepID=A0A8D8LLF6_9HEMI
MKNRFSTFDLICSVTELQKLVGMRLNQVYDIDHKTYLLRFQRTEEKQVLLIESGNRIHTTAFEWPKNVAPSGFSMKMRKHLKNKRLESLKLLGLDRIIDLQFGTGEAEYHIIVELYDRGNIVLTDKDYIILNVLRPHSDGEEVRFYVREKYPVDLAKNRSGAPTEEMLREMLAKEKPGDQLKKIFVPKLDYGPAIIEHVLMSAGFPNTCKLGKDVNIDTDLPRLVEAFKMAEQILDQALTVPSKGYLMQKKEKRPNSEEFVIANMEFHPMIQQTPDSETRVMTQHSSSTYQGFQIEEFESFAAAVDEFFSTAESNKIDLKAVQQERDALKKLENVKRDHVSRLNALEETQLQDKEKAELIIHNQEAVDAAILAIRQEIANQLSWEDIEARVKQAQRHNDPVASIIKQLKLNINHITLLLSDPFADSADNKKPSLVDVDLDLSAYANAKRYFDQKRSAAKKQQKTIQSTEKALKSAEKKTKQTLKDVQTMTNINKARKVYWFEKFYWFISSENYLVIGGRDMQQNELIVKRYLRANDVYVHADITGASSVVVKNPGTDPIPPKTLTEAGIMAVCYSVAWDAKVVTNAWWVRADQVSKTAPTGEFLTTGSFMIRGKKNFFPPCQLAMGISFLFKLEESSVVRHKDERRVRSLEEEAEETFKLLTRSGVGESHEGEGEVEVSLSGDDEEDEEEDKMKPIPEEKEEEGEGREEQEEEEEKSESEEEQEGGGMSFPDTQIKVDHAADRAIITGNTKLETKKLNTKNQNIPGNPDEEDDEDEVVFLGDDKPVVVKQSQAKPKTKQNLQQHKRPNPNQREHRESERSEQESVDGKPQNQPIKRGQKGKLKKMKEKYKDQDEEERKLKMEILQSAGSSNKENKKSKKGKKDKGGAGGGGGPKPDTRPAEAGPKPQTLPRAPPKEGETEDGEEVEVENEPVVSAEVDMLDSLTGQPCNEDELLFAVPVIAPYVTLTNYKYKVKLIPGTGKRGKASKTAQNIFLKDKNASAREKDLIKSVKDEVLARNIPGKVKLSAAQNQLLKARKR